MSKPHHILGVFALAILILVTVMACGGQDDATEPAADGDGSSTEGTSSPSGQPTESPMAGAPTEVATGPESRSSGATPVGSEPTPSAESTSVSGQTAAATEQATTVPSATPEPPVIRRQPTPTPAGSAQMDREALVALFESAGGPNWDYSSNWMTDSPLNEWEGVVTDSNDRVVLLLLDRNELNGEIPPELGDLAQLKVLGLGGNQLSGGIPPELGKLSSLLYLHLKGNQLSGEIPAAFGNLRNLHTINLSVNQLTGEIPPELDRLTNLYEFRGLHIGQRGLSVGDIIRELEEAGVAIPYLRSRDQVDFTAWTDILTGNTFSGCISDFWSEVHGPTELLYQTRSRGISIEIPKCDASDPGDAQALVALYNATSGDGWENESRRGWMSFGPIGEWAGVTTNKEGKVIGLNLQEFGLSGEIPSELAALSKLEFLNLERNELSGRIPEELANLSDLKLLYLSDNQLTGEIPKSLGDLANLRFIDFRSNSLSGQIPPELGNAPRLEILHLSGNQLTGEIPGELGNLTELKFLWLGNNELRGPIPPELGNLANLGSMALSGNQLTGSIPPELGNLSRLSDLYLHENRLTGEVPPELGSLSRLTELRIQDNNLTGCIPSALKEGLSSRNNLQTMGGLFFCP